MPRNEEFDEHIFSVSVARDQSVAFLSCDDSFHGKLRVFALLNSPRVVSSLSDHIVGVPCNTAVTVLFK